MLTDLYLTKSIVLLRFITNIITLERNGILILMLNLQVQNIITFFMCKCNSQTLCASKLVIPSFCGI